MSAIAIIAGVGAATGIVSAISSGKQQGKAIKNQRSIALEQLENERLLNEATLAANNANFQTKIKVDSIVSLRQNQQNAIIQATIAARQMAKDTEKKNLVYLAIGGGVIVVGAIAVLKLS